MADYDERETVVRIGERSELVSVWTCRRAMANRLQRKGHRPTRESRSRDGRNIGWWFEVPVKLIGLRISPAAVLNPAKAIP